MGVHNHKHPLLLSPSQRLWTTPSYKTAPAKPYCKTDKNAKATFVNTPSNPNPSANNKPAIVCAARYLEIYTHGNITRQHYIRCKEKKRGGVVQHRSAPSTTRAPSKTPSSNKNRPKPKNEKPTPTRSKTLLETSSTTHASCNIETLRCNITSDVKTKRGGPTARVTTFRSNLNVPQTAAQTLRKPKQNITLSL